jgi:type VI protein secretion system component Hcp
MPSAGWSNIFLQMMAGDPIPLPVIGEGQLELPWATQVELTSFSWDIKYKHKYTEFSEGTLGGAVKGMAAGAAGGVAAGLIGGQAGLAAAAIAAAKLAADAASTERSGEVELGTIKIVKRFDIASSRIQACADMNIPIFSALISVLHIKGGSHLIHEPGFTILATDGFIQNVSIDMEKGDKGVEVMEKFELQFKNIIVAYSKRLFEHNLPMPPFEYNKPDKP